MTKIPLKDNQNAKKLSTDVFDDRDQDKDGFKLENVGPTFSSFAVVTHLKSVVLLSLVQPIVLESLLIFL